MPMQTRPHLQRPRVLHVRRSRRRGMVWRDPTECRAGRSNAAPARRMRRTVPGSGSRIGRSRLSCICPWLWACPFRLRLTRRRSGCRSIRWPSRSRSRSLIRRQVRRPGYRRLCQRQARCQARRPGRPWGYRRVRLPLSRRSARGAGRGPADRAARRLAECPCRLQVRGGERIRRPQEHPPRGHGLPRTHGLTVAERAHGVARARRSGDTRCDAQSFAGRSSWSEPAWRRSGGTPPRGPHARRARRVVGPSERRQP
jgi:hypothetical protein